MARDDDNSKRRKLSRKHYRRKAEKKPGSHDELTLQAVCKILGPEKVQAALDEDREFEERFEYGAEIHVSIVALSAQGDGLGYEIDKATIDSAQSGSTESATVKDDWLVLVPFTLPGEIVKTRIYRNTKLHSLGDLLEITTPAPLRDNSQIKCPYFGKCSGCQYQMLPYTEQLKIKTSVLESAFRDHSGLSQSEFERQFPNITAVHPSPSQWGYRTKLTPHFDVRKGGFDDKFEMRIGFETKGRKAVIDIEECPIATKALNLALPVERGKILQRKDGFKKGATLLLRDSLDPSAFEVIESGGAPLTQQMTEANHVCITDHKATVYENVAGKLFTFPAGSFFQNNNSVLGPLLEYIKNQYAMFGPGSSKEQPTYLVDTYCGSGLFSISLAEIFSQSLGIEIDARSVEFARKNAETNNVENATFLVGDAQNIFEQVKDQDKDRTTVIIDPPRKGCNEAFLNQLLDFNAATIIYISCNVHTQARDIGYLLRRQDQQALHKRYKTKSITGFDLFPQTHHCEGVVVLQRE